MFKRLFWCNGTLNRPQFAKALVLFALFLGLLFIGMHFMPKVINLMTGPAPEAEKATLADVASHAKNSMTYARTYMHIVLSLTAVGLYMLMMQLIRRLRDTGLTLYLILIPLISALIQPWVGFVFVIVMACYPSRKMTLEVQPESLV